MRHFIWDNVCGRLARAVESMPLTHRVTPWLCGFGALLTAALVCLLLSGMAPLSAYADEVDAQTQEAIENFQEAFTDAYEEAQDEEAESSDMASSKNGGANEGSTGKEALAKSSGPMKQSPFASPLRDLAVVLLGIIIATSVFFFVSNGRLNKNIDKMRRFVD